VRKNFAKYTKEGLFISFITSMVEEGMVLLFEFAYLILTN
jgi:hypothetical protein